jgi:hypothetical protein
MLLGYIDIEKFPGLMTFAVPFVFFSSALFAVWWSIVFLAEATKP